ncbi:hypothetical protein C8J57DRAFT_1316319 [Mycena rebaudengoi]|nr:hypothetical protein C8J57DRAFT_1316319 [Mycena rebaudengoi]
MPDTDRARLIPGSNLPIAEFLELSFPKKSSALVFTKPASWFNVEKPTMSVDCLLLRLIPPKQFLDDLAKEVGQAWIDGRKSIINNRSPV